MHKFSRFILLVSIAAISASALAQRVLPPVNAFTDYRSIGERRVWTFVAHDSTIGRLNSVVEEQTTVNGVAGVAIAEDLALDFRRSGTPSVQQYKGTRFVALSGVYLGDDLSVIVNDQTGGLSLKRNGDILSGYTERGGEKSPQSIAVPQGRFAWENLFVDQLETFLAMRGVREGEAINDSVFAPLTLLTNSVRGEVESFGWRRLFNDVFDSVFIINMREPQPLRLYFTKDRQLRKVEAPLQEMKIYLDLVAPKQTASKTSSAAFSLSRLLKVLPQVGLFLLVASLVSLFFVRGKMRFGEHYLGALAGMIFMWLIPVTQVPLQEWAITQWLLPGLKAGKSIFLLGALPAVFGGVIQCALLTIAILFDVSGRGLQQTRAMAAGVLCGAGFGFMLACYLTYIGVAGRLLDMEFVERSFQILFHAASGLIIAALYCRSMASAVRGAIVLACLNSLFYYLVVFAQQQIIDAGMLTFLLAFVVLGTAAWAVMLQRRSSRN